MAPQNDNGIDCQDRRTALKKLAAGVGVLAGCSVLPEKWTTPIIGQITLPAHAATSALTPVATEATETVSVDGFNSSEVYSLRALSGNDKRYTWLNKTGSAYGGQVKFEFSGCGELIVPNAAVTHGADGNTGNHNQAFYFCGTDFAPGTKENNGGKASVFAPPGCGASSVTLYYNK